MKNIILTIIVLILTILNIILFKNYFINLQNNKTNYNVVNNNATSSADLKIKVVNGEGIVVGVRRKEYPNGILVIPEYTENGIPITTIDSFAFYKVVLRVRLECPYIKEIKNFAFYRSDIAYINWDRRKCKTYKNSFTRN